MSDESIYQRPAVPIRRRHLGAGRMSFGWSRNPDDVGTHRNQIVAIKPVLDAPVNHGHLCVKGSYAFDFVDAPDRFTVPIGRTNGGWRPLSWHDAISLTVRRLQEISKEHGPNSIGVLWLCARDE